MHWAIVLPFAEQVEHLRVRHADEKVEAGVRVRHDEEQRRLLIAQRVQLQFIVHCEVIVGRDFPKLFDIEYREARATADQNALCSLA